MGQLIAIEVVRNQRRLTIDEAWENWRALNEKAKASEKLTDALEAGKAWAEFLRQFEPRR